MQSLNKQIPTLTNNTMKQKLLSHFMYDADCRPVLCRHMQLRKTITRLSYTGSEYIRKSDLYSMILDHPLRDVLVQFTAVVVSNPKTSGLASFQGVSEEFPKGRIGRIHIFVADTNAVHWEGMECICRLFSLWSPGFFDQLEDLLVGDVMTVRGRLRIFQFNSTIRMNIIQRPGKCK